MAESSRKHARWFPHVNAVNPSRTMRAWLTDRMSLTAKLIAHSRHFRVCPLQQRRALSLADEYAAIHLPRRLPVRERDVLLQCDGRAVVYAHTVVPLHDTAADWPFFRTLGSRSLGSALFSDPLIDRGALQFARLLAGHPLIKRAEQALGMNFASASLFARRCLYRRKHGHLLVTEVFLPAIADLTAMKGKPPMINEYSSTLKQGIDESAF